MQFFAGIQHSDLQKDGVCEVVNKAHTAWDSVPHNAMHST